jgi:tetratricopeptide (TPR) repeat protein
MNWNKEAIQQYTEALRLVPGDAEAHFCLGCLLAKTGHQEEAVTCLEEALRLKPDYADAKRELQTLNLNRADF